MITVEGHCIGRFFRGRNRLREESRDYGVGGEDGEDGSACKDYEYLCNLRGGYGEEGEGKIDEGGREEERDCKFVELAGGSKKGQDLRHRRRICSLQGTH